MVHNLCDNGYKDLLQGPTGELWYYPTLCETVCRIGDGTADCELLLNWDQDCQTETRGIVSEDIL